MSRHMYKYYLLHIPTGYRVRILTSSIKYEFSEDYLYMRVRTEDRSIKYFIFAAIGNLYRLLSAKLLFPKYATYLHMDNLLIQCSIFTEDQEYD